MLPLLPLRNNNNARNTNNNNKNNAKNINNNKDDYAHDEGDNDDNAENNNNEYYLDLNANIAQVVPKIAVDFQSLNSVQCFRWWSNKDLDNKSTCLPVYAVSR